MKATPCRTNCAGRSIAFRSLEPQAGITAGLRISAGGACVDGSIEGLLRQRTRIEALLLAEIGKQHATPA